METQSLQGRDIYVKPLDQRVKSMVGITIVCTRRARQPDERLRLNGTVNEARPLPQLRWMRAATFRCIQVENAGAPRGLASGADGLSLGLLGG